MAALLLLAPTLLALLPLRPADEPPAGPTVVLVTWDTTRADHVGAYGSERGATPVLDALAAGGVLFERAWAPAPITLPSHVTLLTGTYPFAHGVRDNALYRVDGESRLLAEALAEHGFRTGAFVGSFVLDRRFGLDQGFERYTVPPTRRLGHPLRGSERPANEVVDDALQFVGGVARTESLFLWLHFFDPHFAYAPPEPQRSRFADDPYAGEIAFCDAQLGRLLAGLDAAGRDGRRLLVVTADHGEALGEHGEATHGVFVYEEALRVPLVLAGDDLPPGVRVDAPVSLADVAPTVLEWLGLPRALLPEARLPSLLSHVAPAGAGDGAPGEAADRATAAEERPIPLESFLPYHAHGWHPLRGLVWRGHKLVLAPRGELYDLASDPDELTNLFEREPRIAAALAAERARLLEEHGRLAWARSREVDGDERAALGALGYLGSRTHGPVLEGLPPDAASLPDAKDGLPLLRRRDDALLLIWRGRRLFDVDGLLAEPGRPPRDAAEVARFAEGEVLLGRARALLDALRAEHPGDPEFAQLLGLVEVTLGRYDVAAPLFEQQARHNPRSPEAHYNLAICYEQTGRRDWARAEMVKALSLEPRALMASLWMADWHANAGEPGHAAWWLSELLARADEAGAASPGDTADEREVARVRGFLAELQGLADRAGQPIAPPPAWPASEFRPECDVQAGAGGPRQDG